MGLLVGVRNLARSGVVEDRVVVVAVAGWWHFAWMTMGWWRFGIRLVRMLGAQSGMMVQTSELMLSLGLALGELEESKAAVCQYGEYLGTAS